MCDKQLLQILEGLGRNSRIARSSLAASEVVAQGDRDRQEDTKCAKTIRNIITSHYGLGTSTNKSLAASDTGAIPSPNRNVNRVKGLTQFISSNGKI